MKNKLTPRDCIEELGSFKIIEDNTMYWYDCGVDHDILKGRVIVKTKNFLVSVPINISLTSFGIDCLKDFRICDCNSYKAKLPSVFWKSLSYYDMYNREFVSLMEHEAYKILNDSKELDISIDNIKKERRLSEKV